MCRKHLANFVYKGERLDYFFPEMGKKTPLLFKLLWEFQLATKGKRAGIKGMKVIHEERGPSLFTDDVIVCVENPKESAKKDHFVVSKITEYKIKQHVKKVRCMYNKIHTELVC